MDSVVKAQVNYPGIIHINHMVMGRHNNLAIIFGKGSPDTSVRSACKDTSTDMLPILERYVEWVL